MTLPDVRPTTELPRQRAVAPEESIGGLARMTRRAQQLEWATCSWNVAEAGIGIFVGMAAGSAAMVGFGLSAIVEVAASLVVLWHLASAGRERLAMRLLAGGFGLVGGYLLVDTYFNVVAGDRAEPTTLSVAAMLFSVLMMMGLASAKYRLGVKMKSRPMVANAKMGLLDGSVGVGVLVALVLNVLFGWWWVDPVATVLVALFALKAGWDTWHDAP